jgi:uncharacterized protein (DUF608 family)
MTREFSGEYLTQIALPLGGIGAGCICLNGYGGLQDFSIRHHPQVTAVPDRHLHQDAAFAIIRFPKSGLTRLVEGPLPAGKIFDQGLKGQGYWGGGHEGLARFREVIHFKGEYPFGAVQLADPDLPVRVKVTGFNPFIPLDVKNSAIPCAILEYELENITGEPVDFEFSYHLSHLAPGNNPREAQSSRNRAIPGRGIYFYNEENPASAEYGSACLTLVGFEPLIKAMWFRGAWIDALSMLWKEVSSGNFRPNDGRNETGRHGRNGGSILLPGRLAAGEKITLPIVITWHFPNVHFSSGEIKGPQDLNLATTTPKWRPYYVSHWEDAAQVADYVVQNYSALRRRTQAFHDALFSSTLPAAVLDGVSANLAIIKSPTVLLQENGHLWGWEGCFSDRGCCPGACTHVWNYAQSIPHLFPQLERSLRELELERSMDENGHVTFRSALPDGPTEHTFYAAADGQLGGVLKVFREWQISGDRKWLLKMYPLVERSIHYCIDTWDPRHQGVLEEPHHNTYDIEFWGPEGMCSSIYIGALSAMAKLARECGHPEEGDFYENLAQHGARYLDERLFNGEYYQQEVKYLGLRDRTLQEQIEALDETAEDEALLLKSEGPKYQYGAGCLSDGVIGAWLAWMCGVETPLSPDHIQASLRSIFKYNFKEALWTHSNPQRPGYAIGGEPGLLLCTWPHGNRPSLPFVYSDEVWTGIEYQVASHMLANGLIDEGITIVQSLRSRYDGRVRNPWNEYECGSYYARAMASYALLPATSGFFYSAPTHTLRLNPQLNPEGFKAFFSTASGWGFFSIHGDELMLELIEGVLQVDEVQVTIAGEKRLIKPGVLARSGETTVIDLLRAK